MLTQLQIESMQQAAELALPDSLTRFTRTTLHLPNGGFSNEWIPMSSCSCRLAPSRQVLNNLSRDPSFTIDQTLLLIPSNFELSPSDRVEVNDVLYVVLTVRPRRAWATYNLAKISRVLEADE